MAIREVLNKVNSKKRSEGLILIKAMQRGTISHTGSADIRANFDTFAIAKVRGRSEMMHALGDLGLDVPDMTTYGEGHAGVWLLATLGGGWSAGRTFKLKDLDDLSAIARARPPRAALPPGLREYLGDSYELLKTGRAVAHVVSDEPRQQPWMTELAREMEEVTEDIFDKMDRIHGQNEENRASIDQFSARPITDLGPGLDIKAIAAVAKAAMRLGAEQAWLYRDESPFADDAAYLDELQAIRVRLQLVIDACPRLYEEAHEQAVMAQRALRGASDETARAMAMQMLNDAVAAMDIAYETAMACSEAGRLLLVAEADFRWVYEEPETLGASGHVLPIDGRWVTGQHVQASR